MTDEDEFLHNQLNSGLQLLNFKKRKTHSPAMDALQKTMMMHWNISMSAFPGHIHSQEALRKAYFADSHWFQCPLDH